MSNFNLTQFKKQDSAVELMQVPKLPWVVAPANTAFSTSVQSALVDADTNLVRIIVDADSFMDYDTNPPAVATEFSLIANREYWFEIDLGSTTYRFAFIDA